MTSSPSTLLPPVLGSIVGGVIGAMATYWLNLRPTQTKDKGARVLESCGRLDEKIKHVLEYLEERHVDISELQRHYFVTAEPGLCGTELDLELYVEYETRLQEIYSKARDLIIGLQNQPDATETTVEAAQEIDIEDSGVHADQTGNGVPHPETPCEPDVGRRLVEITRDTDTSRVETTEPDMTPTSSIIDDRLPHGLHQAVSLHPKPGSIHSTEEPGEIAGRQRPHFTATSAPTDKNTRENNDECPLIDGSYSRLYSRMYCYRHCIAFNAGSLSVYYCVKGPPTARKSMYTELEAKPPLIDGNPIQAGPENPWPQTPMEGLLEALPLEVALHPRGSVSTGPELTERVADGMRVSHGSSQLSESEFEQTLNHCCCFCGQELQNGAKDWESPAMSGWLSEALCDSCAASARKVFRITYNKIL